MATGDRFKRTLDAGTSFLGMTRERAESVVREWVESGDLRKARAQKAIDDLMARSRKMTDDLREMIRREVKEQVSTLGFVTHDELTQLEDRLGTGAPAARAAPAAKSATKQPPVKKSAAKKGPAKAATAKNAPAKAATAKKAPAKAATAKKAPAKRVSAKKAPAKKAGPSTKGAPIKRAGVKRATTGGRPGEAGEA
ncbi:MAG: hypothetical protein M3179_09160 [Actinomycetota bacterium]|nr:hypothetical protein [Actinomycetota bacterium]